MSHWREDKSRGWESFELSTSEDSLPGIFPKADDQHVSLRSLLLIILYFDDTQVASLREDEGRWGAVGLTFI